MIENANRNFFVENVWPQVPHELKVRLYERYPHVRVGREPGFTLLGDVPVCMVVGLTGTGKSTTLATLADMRQNGDIHYCEDIPTRRELADLIIIPTAQVISGDPVRPVADREQRFAYTYKFAHEFETGGSAAAFGWLYFGWDGHTTLLSDGLRGPREIAYALANYPQWAVAELWVDPVIRLQRLTDRKDRFDYLTVAPTAVDLSFLPADRHAVVRRLLANGSISPKAVVTARAESQNYGQEPFDRANTTTNYRCLLIDDLTPGQVAAQVAELLPGARHVEQDTEPF